MALYPKLLLVFFSLFAFAPSGLSNDYFDKLYDEINSNIEQETFETNFKLIDQLENEEAFHNLDCYLRGKIYHKIGVSYYLAYQEQKALTYYVDKVLELWKNCGQVPESEMANTVYNAGICYQYLGMDDQAKAYLDSALIAFEKDDNYPELELGRKYYGIGLFYQGINDFFRADLNYSTAISIFRKQNAVFELFKTLNDVLILQLDFKQYQKALQSANQALKLATDHPEKIPDLNLALIYLNAGTVNLELKKIDKAGKLADRALRLLNKSKDAPQYAIGLELRAFCAMENEQFEKAEKLMNEVLAIRTQFYQGEGGLEVIGLTYENLAEMYMRNDDLAKANAFLRKGFEIAVPHAKFGAEEVPTIDRNRILDDKLLIRLIELKTKIYEKQYQRTKNIELLQNSLNIQHKIDSILLQDILSFQFQQSRLDFMNLGFVHYGKAIKDALRLYQATNDRFYLEEAYRFSARTKALVLQQELNRVSALRTNVDREILQKENALRKTMNDRQSLLFEAVDTAKDSLLQNYLQSQNELEAFLKEVERNEPEYFNERYRFLEVPTARNLQKKIPDDLAMIEYFVAQDTIHSFWITNEHFFSVSIPRTTSFENAISQFGEQCRSPEKTVDVSIAKQIYDQLLEKGLSRIPDDVKRIYIVPDGDLHSLSFEALHDGNDYLIRRFAISYTYAAALMERQESYDDKPSYNYVGFGTLYSTALTAKLRAQKRFFGEGQLSQLTMSRDEVESAAEIFDGRTFIDGKATLSNFFDYAVDAEILHLSLHGLVDFTDPDRSCIIFDDAQADFLLSPHDLYRTPLKAELVLLSACHSASGKIYDGEGVQGMSKAFLLGGAHNILSSLWNASEASSMKITRTFLQNIANGISTDLALRRAKLDYLENATPSQAHPYYWANFIVLGEMDADGIASGTPYLWLIPVLILCALGIVVFLKIRRKRL